MYLSIRSEAESWCTATALFIPFMRRGVATLSKKRPSQADVIKLFSEILDTPKDVTHQRLADPLAPQPRDKTSDGENESDAGIPELMKTTNQLVDAAAYTRIYPARGWKHTKSLRGDERRIESALKSAVTYGAPLDPRPSLQAISADEDVDDLEEGAHQIRPGTFVDIRRSASTSLQSHAHGLITPCQRVIRGVWNCTQECSHQWPSHHRYPHHQWRHGRTR